MKTVQIPVSYRINPFANVDKLPAFASAMRAVKFELRYGMDGKELFYECVMPGCRGAGCASFAPDHEFIPEEVLTHMKLHAGLCMGIRRVTEAS